MADWNDTMWLSAGPFIFDTWNKGEFIRLVRNDNYWKIDPATGQQLPYLDEVIFRFIPDTTALVNAWKARELDVINPPPDVGQLEELIALEAEGASVEVLGGPVWEHLNFQLGDGRLARNPGSYNEHIEFRRAVAHAIDKDRIVDGSLRGRSSRLTPMSRRTALACRRARGRSTTTTLRRRGLDRRALCQGRRRL